MESISVSLPVVSGGFVIIPRTDELCPSQSGYLSLLSGNTGTATLLQNIKHAISRCSFISPFSNNHLLRLQDARYRCISTKLMLLTRGVLVSVAISSVFLDTVNTSATIPVDDHASGDTKVFLLIGGIG
jgi:hypothetical protein